MAGQDRGTSPDLERMLLREGHRFSFFQAIRLLRLLVDSDHSDGEPFNSEDISIRPDISLGFPAADVARVEQLPGQEPSFQLTATFLGLYGSSSPLPTFYSEDLLDEAGEDESVIRDFLDAFNHRIHVLFYRCWSKYRQFVQVAEERSPQHVERLFCLLGLGEQELLEDVPEPYRLIRYLGIFTQAPRSALGLKTLLQDALGGVPVEVIPCVPRMATIPPDQRSSLGGKVSSLGGAVFLGTEIEDRMGKFSIQIGPLHQQQFQTLLPGTPNYDWLTFLTEFYVQDPLRYELELILAAGEVQSTCLGAPEWSRLGVDTWTFSSDSLGEVKAHFDPSRN